MHDDRVDALEGSVRYWGNLLAQDQADEIQKVRQADALAKLQNPLGRRDYSTPGSGGSSMFTKYTAGGRRAAARSRKLR